MSDQARLPTIQPLSTDVEALLVYERQITLPLDLVRARALARARVALSGHAVPSIGRSLVAHQHAPLPLAAGIAVAAGIALAIELLLSAGIWQASTRGNRRADSLRQPTSTVRERPILPAVVEPPSAETPNHGAVMPEDGLEELRLLDRARQFDRRGDYNSALASTREHQRRFSNGRLVEEREALRIRALMGLGRVTEASESAAFFKRRFPHSVLLDTIDRMMASLR
jgi:hypothetical protein